MYVSVIVVCYNEEKNIRNCIESICNIKYPDNKYEIIVIDNNSEDNTRSIIYEFIKRYKNIQLLINSERGIAISRNIGIKNAIYPYIAFTDADCVVPEDWLNVLVSGFIKYKIICPELVAVGGTNYAPENEDIFYDTINITLKTILGNRGSTQGKEYKIDTLVSHIPTLNILYDKNILEKYNGFDEKFSFVCEDPELNYRLIKSGYKIMMLNNSYVIHRFKKGYVNWIKNIFKYGTGRIQIIKKHPSHFNFVYLVPPIILIMSLWCIISMLFTPKYIILFIMYNFILLIYSMYYCYKQKKSRLITYAYFIYLITHLAYGFGELNGLLNILFNKFKRKTGNYAE